MTRRRALLAVAIAVASLPCAGSVRLQADRERPAEAGHYSSKIDVARTLQQSVEARRIVSIIPATTEMLFAMGAGDRVVAVGSYDRFPPEVDKLPRVGALLDPNVERILALKPDLVVIYGTQTDLRTQLERARIPIYAYVHRGLPDVTETIRTLGARVGVGARANALADRIERQLADIRSRVANRARPKTLLVFGREPGTLRGIEASGGVGFLHDMLETAGGANVMADVKQQSAAMSTELVLARAPEVIVELRYARGDAAPRDDLKVWDTLASVPAVKDHSIIVLQGEEFVVPGPRVAEATAKLAAVLHPLAFR
ncbi:MAG TPA: helical backbone metal receptor [Vicinamibacterales bacterium]|nr:helical backbone metal receptor [Vicinamibacterales bacterium]